MRYRALQLALISYYFGLFVLWVFYQWLVELHVFRLFNYSFLNQELFPLCAGIGNLWQANVVSMYNFKFTVGKKVLNAIFSWSDLINRHIWVTIQIIIEHLTNIVHRDTYNFLTYVSVLPTVCDENVWTFTRITRIYPLCCVQWISQVRFNLLPLWAMHRQRVSNLNVLYH